MKTEQKVKVTFDFPIETARGRVDSVTMRRPTMKEQLDFPMDASQGVEDEMRLYARLTGLDFEDVLLLDMGDYERLQEQFITFRRPESQGHPPAGRGPGKAGQLVS